MFTSSSAFCLDYFVKLPTKIFNVALLRLKFSQSFSSFQGKIHMRYINILMASLVTMLTLIISILFLSPAHAAKETEKKPPVQIWSEWYTYSLAGVVQGYYQEKVERRPSEKQIAVSQSWVEKDNGGTESFIGSVASDDGKFSPIAFFSEKSSPKKRTKLDGRVKGKNIILSFKASNAGDATIKKTVPFKQNMVLSNFVGMMLAKKEATKPIHFTAIVEDAQDGNFDTRLGEAQIVGVNKQVRGFTCRKVEMNFDHIDSEWWITNEGKVCEVFIPQNQAKLQISNEDEAKKSFKQ